MERILCKFYSESFNVYARCEVYVCPPARLCSEFRCYFSHDCNLEMMLLNRLVVGMMNLKSQYESILLNYFPN